MENVSVECHAGSRAEEYPLRFWVSGRRVEIKEVKKRWLTPGCRCFKVLGNDNVVYDLEYDSHSDRWRLLTINRP